MKKVLVILVLFVLLVGVMPVSAEAENIPEIPKFNEVLFSLLRSSPYEVQIGRIKSIHTELGKITIKWCIYTETYDGGEQSPCLSFFVTNNTKIWIDGIFGPGNINDLEEEQAVAVEYYVVDGETYALHLLASSRFDTFPADIHGIYAESRVIEWCPWIAICPYGMPDSYVPEAALITFQWDEEHHYFEELLYGDLVNLVVYFEDDSLPVPIIHVTGNRSGHREQQILNTSHTFMLYAPFLMKQ